MTAACLAHAGHHVVAFDDDADVVARLSSGRSPVSEPGLDALIRSQLDAGRLSFKVGTDTLRRSSALSLCRMLARDGIAVRTHDPAVHALPPDVPPEITLCATAEDALDDARALVVETPWPEFRSVSVDDVVARMASPNVVDAAGALVDTLGNDPRVRYVTVGKAPA